MSKIEQPINGHPILDPFTWLVNIIVQPRTGEGSSPANGEHFQANLDEIRSKLVERIDVANRLDVTESNKVLDARQAGVLVELINEMTSLVWQVQVEDEKATPTEGRFIVADGATGDWAGHEGEIVEWDGEWQFTTPENGWAIYLEDRGELWAYHDGWRVMANLGKIRDYLLQTEQARDDVLLDTGFQAVAGDLTGSNNIGTVAGSIGNVNTVGGSIANVNKVGAIDSKVTTVANNNANVTKVANIDTNVSKVANIDTDVTKVANIDGAVSNVSSIQQDVSDVAGIKSDVTDVANIKADVSDVADIKVAVSGVNANKSNINTVAGNNVNVSTVATNIGNVNKVGAIDTNVTKVANIDSDVTKVAGIDTAVSNVSGIKDNVVSVDGNKANINAVNANKTNIDKVANNETNINKVATVDSAVSTVAGVSANVTAVAGISGDVTDVAGIKNAVSNVSSIKDNVTAVDGNKANINAVAGNKSNIDKVANINTQVTTVAGIDSAVSNVASISSDVTNVASIKQDVTDVAGIKTNVTNVAGIKNNVVAVDGNKTNINAVHANKTNIDAVAGNKTNIDAVKNNESNINAVAGNIGGANTIGTVAGSIGNVNNVGGNIINVNAVAGNKNNIDAVAGNKTNIDKVAGMQANINALAPHAQAIEDLGERTAELDLVAEALGDIESLEKTANKKSTLSDNSEIYYPNQKAVNDGLNMTMAEMMGFAPRNLMTVFGTATVAETFAELRARAITGDFSTLRLGDYIDLPSLTIGADSVNPHLYPARTINNDYNRLRVEIVGFDDYYYVGNTAYPTQHHVTMMFKDIPTTAPFNRTNITTGDYPGSELFRWLHERFEPALISVIGIEPRAVDRRIGTVADWGWVGSEKIFLPTNVNIFGTTGFSHTNYGTGTQTQFALFALNPNRKIKKRNGSRYYWWFAEPSANSSTRFCDAYSGGYARDDGASYTYGVVPAFLI